MEFNVAQKLEIIDEVLVILGYNERKSKYALSQDYENAVTERSIEIELMDSFLFKYQLQDENFTDLVRRWKVIENFLMDLFSIDSMFEKVNLISKAYLKEELMKSYIILKREQELNKLI